ncbi:unnamed protein product, partial [Rotaria sp. Silwood1]
SLSTSEGHLSDENSDDDNDDDDDDDDNDDDNGDDDNDDDDHMPSRPANITPKRHNVMSDSSDSEIDRSSKTKTKTSTVFDNNVFDAEESDEPTKPINRKKKINQQQTQQINKSTLKTNNEPMKKEKLTKTNDEQLTTKKKLPITKTIDKRKSSVNSIKSTSKVAKTKVSTPKRPSTDESNESTKKLKVDDEKPKITSIEEQTSSTIIPVESDSSLTNKPSITLTSPSDETATTNEPKIDEPSTEIQSQTTPTKFGIVFASHHRHSVTPPSSSSLSGRTQSTETSKNDDENMENDNESISINNNDNNDTTLKDEQIISNTNTLKPPTITTQPPLSDDETLNPETMQLSDLISTRLREGTKPVQSRSTTKATGKGKRQSKQDTSSTKRLQTKTNAKTIQSTISNEKESESIITSTDSNLLSSIEQPALISTNIKRLSITESSSISSPINDKEPKRLRKSTDDSTVQLQNKVELNENLSPKTNIQTKEDTIASTVSSEKNKQETPSPAVLSVPPSTIDQPQIIPMETDQIPLSSSIVTSTQSPLTTSTETEIAIKALCSSIQIPQQSLSKTSNLEKSSPIIAPISKETLPIVEHQPTSITTTSILPSHVPIKSSLTSATFNENVEETLSAVNSLLMLNNNTSNISGDHPAIKGAARITPTISKPVYSYVASLPSPTDQQTRQVATTPTTTSVSTVSTQQNDLITMVSNIVSSSNITGEKPPITTSTTTTTTTTTTTRSHIGEVIDDVAKSLSTTTSIITEPTTSIVDTNSLSSSTSTGTNKSTSIPNILRDVMKTPCLTSSTTASETLNLFDPHHRSTSPLKTTTTITTTTPAAPANISTTTISANIPTTATTTASSSTTPIVPVLVRPTLSKTPTSHKRSSTPKTELPQPSSTASSAMMHPFSHMLTPDGSIFAAAAAAAHHQSFPFPLFAPLSSNPTGNSSSNLLAPSLVSSSPPLSTRTSSTSSSSPSTSSHIINHSFLNTIMAGQQNSSSTNPNPLTHEKASKRDSISTKSSNISLSSTNRSTSIQQTVPVPIPLTIPSSSSTTSSSSSSSSNLPTNTVINQQQQASPLLNSLDAAAVAMRQQASPLQQFLGPDSVVPFRNVYADASELYGAPPSLYPPPNMAYAAAQQMLNVMGMTGSHHPFAADLYSNPEPYFRLNPPTNELSRDPYNVQWQGNLILKNDQAYVKTQLVAGSPQIARASMNYWNSDSLSTASSNLQSSSHHNLRISQRMRLEQAQLEGVQKRMQMDNDHCILIAEPNGSTPDEIRIQQNNLKNGVIRYFDEKKAAGIVNVLLPGVSQPAYVVHIFPPCQFASEILQKRAPDTYRCVVQNKIEQIYLLIVITSTVQ